MADLVEKVARAIAESDTNEDCGICLYDVPSYRKTVTKHAQAALAAIREAGFVVVPLAEAGE